MPPSSCLSGSAVFVSVVENLVCDFDNPWEFSLIVSCGLIADGLTNDQLLFGMFCVCFSGCF